ERKDEMLHVALGAHTPRGRASRSHRAELVPPWAPPRNTPALAGRRAKRALLREAVEQAAAAGSDEAGLRAVARHVRRDGGVLVHRVGDAFAVAVAEHGAAEVAARPVIAGEVHVRRERAAFEGRAGQHVVLIRRIAANLGGLALLVEAVRL